MQTRVATWNVEWANLSRSKGRSVATRLESLGADVLCVTEGYSDVLPEDGYSVDSMPDYGYPIKEGRRKVLLWSRSPWVAVDRIGSTDLPPGRFVSGITETPLGQLRVVGVCIPWSKAHVSTGRGDRKAWEEHIEYLHALGGFLKGHTEEMPTVVAGDFNQQVPPGGRYFPRRISDALQEALAGFRVITQGAIPGLDRPSIDHIAIGAGLASTEVVGWPGSADGVRLSDHSGVAAVLARSARAPAPIAPADDAE